MMQKSRKVAHCFELFLFFCYLDCNNLIYKLLVDSFRDEESGLRAVCVLCLTVTHFPMNYPAVDNPVDKNIQKDIFTNIRLCILHPELLVYVNRNILTDEMEGIGNVGASVWYNGIYFFFTICFPV